MVLDLSHPPFASSCRDPGSPVPPRSPWPWPARLLPLHGHSRVGPLRNQSLSLRLQPLARVPMDSEHSLALAPPPGEALRPRLSLSMARSLRGSIGTRLPGPHHLSTSCLGWILPVLRISALKSFSYRRQPCPPHRSFQWPVCLSREPASSTV